MANLIFIGMGGFLGAVLRYQVSGWVQTLSRSAGFPYGTLAVNVAGSFTIGLCYFFIESRGAFTPQARAFLLIGLLGAFTTFSTFSMETLNLASGGELGRAGLNLLANASLALLAVWAGRMLPYLIWR